MADIARELLKEINKNIRAYHKGNLTQLTNFDKFFYDEQKNAISALSGLELRTNKKGITTYAYTKNNLQKLQNKYTQQTVANIVKYNNYFKVKSNLVEQYKAFVDYENQKRAKEGKTPLQKGDEFIIRSGRDEFKLTFMPTKFIRNKDLVKVGNINDNIHEFIMEHSSDIYQIDHLTRALKRKWNEKLTPSEALDLLTMYENPDYAHLIGDERPDDFIKARRLER